MIVDSHCHLNFPDFKDGLDEVIDNAHSNDVGIMQTICTKLEEFDEVHALTQKYDNIYCSAGVHPCNVRKDIASVDEILALTKRDKVIGIGETGLDYYHSTELAAEQRESFKNHIEVARKTGLPAIVHTRDADDDTVNILQEEMSKGEFKALIHCFTASRELAFSCIEIGIPISLAGIITFKNAQAIRDTVKDLPLEMLLIETDSPYLAPTPHRGKRNEPAYTKHTCEMLAEIKNVSYEEAAKQTTENFLRLFDRVEV